MADNSDVIILPDYEERNQVAREVLDFLRPKGYPIRMIREILNLAIEKLDGEPLREPRAVYEVKKQRTAHGGYRVRLDDGSEPSDTLVGNLL